MSARTTWEPLAATYDRNDNGKLDRRERRALPETAFAFPVQRELPLVDAEHVRAALTALDRVLGASDAERETAAENIRAAAAHYGVEI